MRDKIKLVKFHIESITPIKVDVLDVKYSLLIHDEKKGEDKMEEFEASFVFRYGSAREYIDLEFRSYLSPSRALSLKNKTERSEITLIIVSDYITPTAQSKMRNNSISFIELDGSIFIRGKSIYVDVRSSKSNRSKISKRSNKLSKKSLHLLEWLLDNEIRFKTYREISKETGVSHGVIAEFLKMLVKMQYLKKSGRKYIKNPDKDLTKFYLKNKL